MIELEARPSTPSTPATPATPPVPGALRPSKSAPRLRMALQIACLFAVVWWLVVPQLRRSSHSLHLLADVDSHWIPVAVIAELASLAVFAMATRTLISAASRPRLHHVLRIDLSSIAVSHCMPGGGAAGTALSWRLLTKAGVPPAEAGFVKLVQGVGSAVILQVMLFGALLVALPTYGLHSWAIYPVAVDGTAVVGVVVGLLASRHPRVRRAAQAVTARTMTWSVIGRHRESLVGLRSGVAGHARAILGDRRRLARVAVWTTANWAFDCLALWASLRAYGGSIPPDGVVLAFGIASMIAWLPITPSGLGVTEGVMIPLLVVFGSTSPAAVLGVLTWRLMSFWLPIPLGGLAYGSLRLQPQ